MVTLARARVGPGVRVLQADLTQPLPFDDASFDLVLSSLTMHYLEHWVPALREFTRILRPHGRLVISTHHPYLTLDAVASYREVAPDPVPVRFYHRPFERMLDDLAASGFRLVAMREPQPTAEAAALDPQLAQRLRNRPQFVILDARRDD
jgi:SAM-dependent methyltransferase